VTAETKVRLVLLGLVCFELGLLVGKWKALS
jgi:hypothetical protein